MAVAHNAQVGAAVGLLVREGTSSRARLLGLLPGIGGLLALRTLEQAGPPIPGA